MQSIDEMVKQLPSEKRQEVLDFVAYLLDRQNRRAHKKPKLSWAGALKDIKGRYTSVDLQHRAAARRVGEE